MNKTLPFSPNWATPPGSTIKDVLSQRDVSTNDFAHRMNIDLNNIELLLNGKLSIDDSIATKLEDVIGSTKSFWLKREEQYKKGLESINEIDAWLKQVPYKDMVRFGWLENKSNIYKSCLDFFNVSNFQEFKIKYDFLLHTVSFRKSSAFISENLSIISWIRRAEIIAENYKCKKWNKELFIETLEEKIKPLTRKKSPKQFLPDLIRYCADCGVAVVIVPTPQKCTASGATKFIDSDKALLILSFRYLSDDQFWFTFFHEAGHLILHSHKSLRIESENNLKLVADEELEANLFAAEMLVHINLRRELYKLKSDKRKILELAMKAGVSPGIIVGQMQHYKIISPSYLNGYKKRYTWEEINEALNHVSH